ncbi:MAG TPA: hypothetical protein VFR24_14685 [Candidatus Angelobacter sp.]|nr:hypothetical protein [Candidatus Angelobacter sp.]
MTISETHCIFLSLSTKLMKKPVSSILLCILLLLCTGCNETYNAQVKLDDLIKLDSVRFGHLNSTLVKAGDIINLNPANKNGTRVGTITVTTSPTVVLDSIDTAAGNSLGVNFSGNVPSGDLKIALTTTITNSTALNLVNPSAVEVEDIVSPLNSTAAKTQLDPLYTNATQNKEILVIVTKLIKADDMKFTFSGATSVSGSVSQLRIGSYTLNVDYTDNVSLHTTAANSASRDTGIFFKVARIVKTDDGKYLPANTNDLNLSGYNLADTVR